MNEKPTERHGSDKPRLGLNPINHRSLTLADLVKEWREDYAARKYENEFGPPILPSQEEPTPKQDRDEMEM
jgi:hypothetical protein